MNELIKPRDGDVLTPMSRVEAEVCVGEIIASHQRTGEKLLELYERDGWKVLGYSSWRECVEERFNFKQSRVYQLLSAARVERNIAPVKKISTMVEKPIPERVVRPLAKLPVEEQREVWQEVVAADVPVTAKRVEQVLSVRQRAQAAVAGTSIKNPYAAIGVLVNLHQQHGEEVFAAVLALAASGKYDSPQKAYIAYRGSSSASVEDRPDPPAGNLIQRRTVSEVKVLEKQPMVCPYCGHSLP